MATEHAAGRDAVNIPLIPRARNSFTIAAVRARASTSFASGVAIETETAAIATRTALAPRGTEATMALILRTPSAVNCADFAPK